MPLKNFSNIGELQEYEFITGEIVSLDYENDTCEIIIEGDTKTGVPIFYHCNPSAQERSNGAVQGGAFGFAKEDKVVVMRQQKPTDGENAVKIFVIGHKAGARPCKPLFIIFSSESGQEAIVWDILHDEIVIELDTLTDIQSTLTAWGVTEQTECVEEIVREYSKYTSTLVGSHWYNETPREADLPPFETHYLSSVSPWAYLQPINHKISDYLLNSGGVKTITWQGQGYITMSLAFFTNPISTKDQTPIPGMWLVDHSGDMLIENWDTTEWGVCPIDYNQSWSSSGRRMNVEQEYIFFRSIFDNPLAGGQQTTEPPTNELYLANSYLSSKDLYILTRDSIYYTASVLTESVMDEIYGTEAEVDALHPGQEDEFTTVYNYLVEQSYYAANPSDPLSPYDPPGFTLRFCLPPITSLKTGIATHGTIDKKKTAVLFEFAFVYGTEYDYHNNNKTWTPAMLRRAKQELRIYYRHPYFKKNVDAVLFKRVNDEREALNLEPLELNWNLYNAAQVFSDDMANRQSLDPGHIGSDGSEPQDRTIEAKYGFHTYPHSQRLWGVAENVISGKVGLPRQLERLVDNTDIDIPRNYTVIRTGVVKTLADGDWQISHDKDGNIINSSGFAWKQSTDHWNNIIYADWTEAGLATQKGKDGNTYATQNFGVIGNPNNYQNQKDQHWAGFATFDSTKLLEYVVENFICDNDKFRRPKIFLCTIPQ